MATMQKERLRPLRLAEQRELTKITKASSERLDRGRRAAALLAVARARIVATAQRSPDRRTDGTATWSLSTLERTLRREGLPRVGATTIRRVLREAGSSYQRTRT